MRPAAAVALLAALAAAALLAEHVWSVGVIAPRADPRSPARPAFAPALLPDRDTASAGALFVVTPFVETRDWRSASGPDRSGSSRFWAQLDITREELGGAALNALEASLRWVSAAAAYALLLDHDRSRPSASRERQPCDAPVADARAGCDRARRVSCAAQGESRSRGAGSAAALLLASARKLARARVERRGGDGGAG